MSKTLTLNIVGTSPLLCHNPIKMGGSGNGLGKKVIPSADDEAAVGVYAGLKGTFQHPAMGIRNGLLDAAKGRRISKQPATFVVGGAVFARDEFVTLVHPESGEPLTTYEVDTRRAVVQRQGVLRSRPRFRDWSVTIVLIFEDDLVSPKVVVELAQLAGRLVGLGDYRPRCKGPFGRYVVRWYEVEGEKRVTL
jgi:hypothetical protein